VNDVVSLTTEERPLPRGSVPVGMIRFVVGWTAFFLASVIFSQQVDLLVSSLLMVAYLSQLNGRDRIRKDHSNPRR
jgi:hypothetical protein